MQAVSKEDEDGYFVGEVRGQRGQVPGNLVEEVKGVGLDEISKLLAGQKRMTTTSGV